MNQWWRSWHGAPTDPKWLAIAQRTQTNAGTVSAVVWALFDCASQAEDRGDLSSFDVESYAAFSGYEATLVAKIIEALTDKKLIQNNRLTAWDKRQPKREDGSAERGRAYRERKRTQANANEHREDKTREDKEKKEESVPLRGDIETDVSRGTSRKPRRKGTKLPLPDDWKPSPAHFAAASRLQLSTAIVEGKAEDMRIWAQSNDIRKASWDATFHGFLRSAANKSGGSGGFGGPRPLQDDSRSASRAAGRLAEAAERGEFSFGPRPSLLPEANPTVVELLPQRRGS